MKLIPPFGQESQGDDFEYVNANPVQGIDGSMVDRKAIEFPMREIVNAIKMSGVTPSNSDLTQLYQAIRTAGIAWSSKINYVNKCVVLGADNTMYQWLLPSGPDATDNNSVVVGPKDPVLLENRDYWKKFDSFSKANVQDLIDLLSVHEDEIGDLQNDVTDLKDLHPTENGLATTTESGHVIIGDGLSVDNTGLITVGVDNKTISIGEDGKLVAQIQSETLTGTMPIIVENSNVSLKFDNKSLVLDTNGNLRVDSSFITGADDPKVSAALLNELNALRQLSIGRPVYHSGTTLPADHAWCDGSFVKFSDRPELEARYIAGAFTGMVLEWDADAVTIANNLGKFRKNASIATGLYLPNSGDKFVKLWNTISSATAGGYNKAGLPNITGTTGYDAQSEFGGAFYAGATIVGQAGSGGSRKNLTFDASKSNATYGNSTTVTPESVNIPVIMYLGKSALMNDVFSNAYGANDIPYASGDQAGVIKVNSSQFTVDKFGTMSLAGYVPTSTSKTKEILTTTGNYTVEQSGWYKITTVGGGGAGGGQAAVATWAATQGYGGYQGGTTSFGTYQSSIGGSGGGGATNPGSGSGGGGAGEIKENYYFLTRDTVVPITIGAGGLPSTTSQNGVGPTAGKTFTAGQGAIGAESGRLVSAEVGTSTAAGYGVGGNGASTPYGYGAGGGGAGGNGTSGWAGGPGGRGGSTLAGSGTDKSTQTITANYPVGMGGAGAPGCIIVECMSVATGSVNTAVTPLQQVVTTDSTFQPEITGWYKITAIGGGGGGGSDPGNNNTAIGGGGGGSGEIRTEFRYLSSRVPVPVKIGIGGTGAPSGGDGTDGTATTVTIGTEVLTAAGGGRGIRYVGGTAGGSGVSCGFNGQNGSINSYGDGTVKVDAAGGMGGGTNAGKVTYNYDTNNPLITKINATGFGAGGGGGWGGSSNNALRSGGSNGANGVVIFEKMTYGGGTGAGADIIIATENENGISHPDNKTVKVKTDGTLYIDSIYGIKAGDPYKNTITASGNWVAPFTGWYKITAIGGGGGGASGSGDDTNAYAGGGGSTGQQIIQNVYIKKDQSCPIVIGTGGAAGASNATANVFNRGYAGTSTTMTIDTTVITALGGNPGGTSSITPGTQSAWPGDAYPYGTSSGTGSQQGCNGGFNSVNTAVAIYAIGGTGGRLETLYGSGGNGGNGACTSVKANRGSGANGGNGAVIIESVDGAVGPINNDWLNDLNAQRILTIGRPVYHTSSSLPADHAWCDGSFIKFSDRPELKLKYDNGGFAGMLLAWDASPATIAANKGMWRPDAATPTGLYLPSDGGLFYRHWNTSVTAKTAGSYNSAGLPNIVGTAVTTYAVIRGPSTGALKKSTIDGGGGLSSPSYSTGAPSGSIVIDASDANSIYGNSTTVMPESINQPVIVYLGKTTIDNTVWYNPQTNSTLGAATTTTLGLTKPDNSTTTVDALGQISVTKKALDSEFLSSVNYLRKLTIGRPVYHTSTTLPDDHSWCDGSFISFTNRPELKEKYDAGGFAGMLLAWNADAATIAANLGKFRPDAATPTGLYLPSDGNQFYRHWNASVSGTVAAGSHNSAGLPNITGTVGKIWNAETALGAFYRGNNEQNLTAAGGATQYGAVYLDASRSNAIYGNSTTVMPESINQPVIVYLGRTVLDNAVFYDEMPKRKRYDYPLLATFYSPLETITGCLSMSVNQGQLSRTGAYADAWAAIVKQAGSTLISDTAWLAEVAANGCCAKFSSGNGSTTFRIPYIPNMYIRGAGSANNGTHIAAGLPNITGTTVNRTGGVVTGLITTGMGGSVTGAFKLSALNTSTYGLMQQGMDSKQLDFDASGSNPIYGNSTTVTPESVAWIPYICMNGVAPLKTDLDLSDIIRITETSKSSYARLDSSFGFPGYTGILPTITWTKTANPYTATFKAPSNGWLMVSATSAGIGESVQVIHPSGLTYMSTLAPASGLNMIVTCPVPKDMTVTLYKWTASLNGTDPVVGFVPTITNNPGDASVAPSSSNNYSTTEVWTGQTWIDGKKIYRLVYQAAASMSLTSNTWYDTPIAKGTIDVIVSGRLLNTKSGRTAGYATNISAGFQSTASTYVQVCSNGNSAVGDTLVIEYTKTS